MTRPLIKRFLVTAGVASLLASGLAACGGSHNNTQVSVTPPPAAQKLEDTFGTTFGIDYRASMDSEPNHPNPGDIIPVDSTKEPTALHS